VTGGRQKHIGRLLETARKIRGLTADLVALSCNVTRGRVYQWEKEKFVLPKNLPSLAAILQMPLSMLIAENGQRPLKKNVDV
jgi:transcriptional regulator with XRE-family HTH domain